MSVCIRVTYDEIDHAFLFCFAHEATARKARRDVAVTKTGTASNTSAMLERRARECMG